MELDLSDAAFGELRRSDDSTGDGAALRARMRADGYLFLPGLLEEDQVHASLDNHSDRYRLSSDSRYQLAGEPVDERWIGPNPIARGPAGKKGKIC